MSTVIELSDAEISELQRYAETDDVTAAVSAAVREYLRYRKRLALLELAGQVEMDGDWDELEGRERRESGHE